MTNWERRAAELLKERDECLELATKNRITADRYREALEHIVKHLEITAGGMAPVSSVYIIATKALT